MSAPVLALVAVALANFALWLPLPEPVALWARTLGALALVILIPGALLVRLLLGAPRGQEAWLAGGTYALGAGFAVTIVTMLLLSYLPGGIDRWALTMVFSAVSLVLVVVVWWNGHLTPDDLTPGPSPNGEGRLPRGVWVALAAVFAVGALMRLTHLGYSEFQGDEARVLLRAGDVLAGFENALMIHHKAPGELLVTAAIYGLSGETSEAAARLPFALASLGGLAATVLLGWRLFGTMAGAAAGLLLAIEGYLVAFGRIVQYQSAIFLLSVAVVLLLHQGIGRARGLTGRLTLAVVLAGGGLLLHYEMLGVAMPALYLLWIMARSGAGWARMLRSALPALAVGALMAALFFVPYLRYPGFSRAYEYVVNERLGLKFPYNNLSDFAQRTMLYSSSYFVIVMLLLAAVAMALIYRRRWGWLAGSAASALWLAAVALGLWQPAWVTLGGRDLSVLLVALPLLGVMVLPVVTQSERLVWLWFGSLAIFSLFIVGRPDSHVYIFVIPWALVAGSAVQAAADALQGQQTSMRVAGTMAGLGLFAFLAWYPWLMFADAPAERLRDWESGQPRAFWYPYEDPPTRAILGFPLRNGWKVVGARYAAGELSGAFESNARPEVADWYTHGFGVCPADDRNFYLTQTVEPTDDDYLAQVQREVEQTHAIDAYATVNGERKLAIYAKDGSGKAAEFDVAEYEAAFDLQTRNGMQSRRGRVVEAAGETESGARFGDWVRLTEYTVSPREVAAGELLDVALYWETLLPTGTSYTIFLHVVDPATNGKVGQLDELPVCGENLTSLWNPGDIVQDVHSIAIAEDASPGVYRLIAGLYDVETGTRLPVYGADGFEMGDAVDLGEIRVR
jgi:hypothetical protein